MRPRWALSAALLAPPSAVAAAPATGPTTAPQTLLATLQQWQFAKMARDGADRPLLPPAPLADVVTLAPDGDHLQVLTRQGPTDGECRVPIAELPGLCTVTILPIDRPGQTRPAPATAPAMPDTMLMHWYAFDRPATLITATFVEVLPANVQLVRSTETPDGGGTQVQLTEQRHWVPVVGGEPGIRLQFTDQGAFGRPPLPTVDVSARSFADLCRTQPAAVARYVEPILRDLRADAAVLPADLPLAYQVLGAGATVDTATADRVRKLVATLDADDFADRDAAEEQLRAIGPLAAVAIGRMDPAKLSPEQRARTAAVLRRFRPVTDADAARLAADVDFLLNCLNGDDGFIVRTALARLRTTTGHDVPFDASLRGQPRRDAVWALRQRLTATASVGQAARP